MNLIECIQSKQSCRRPLQFPHLTIKISILYLLSIVSAGFFCQFFMPRALSLPHTPELHIDFMSPCQAAKYAPFVLSCPPALQRLPRGCRRRCTGFPSVAAWLCPVGDTVLFLCPERAFHCIRPHTLASSFRATKSFSFFFSPLYSKF